MELNDNFFVLFQQLQVFRPFFIQLNLPYSVIRGEIVAIQVVLFNYMNKKIEAELTFENIGDFEFIENGSDDNELTRKYTLFNLIRILKQQIEYFGNTMYNWPKCFI